MAGAAGAGGGRAGILGDMIFYPLAMSFTGLLLGMDTLVAQAFGRQDVQDAPAHADQRRLARARAHPSRSLLTLAAIPADARVGANPKVMAECAPVHARDGLGHAAAVPLHGFPPLSAGAQSRQSR